MNKRDEIYAKAETIANELFFDKDRKKIKKRKTVNAFLDLQFANSGSSYGPMTEREEQSIRIYRRGLSEEHQAMWDFNIKQVDQIIALSYNEKEKRYDGHKALEEDPTKFTVLKDLAIPYLRIWFHPVFLRLVRVSNGEFLKIPLGDANEDVAPKELESTVETNYVQLDKSFCLYYSMASALHYCGCKAAGREVFNHAKKYQHADADTQITKLIELMEKNVPSIGRCMKYNVRTSKKKKRNLELAELCETKTPYPTIVVPQCVDGGINHAVTVVDDLVFDATQSNALKLKEETFEWICVKNDGFQKISKAFRFHKAIKPKMKWAREIETNWKEE